MSHYLVTGGAGFIGSHLVDRLIREGHAVRILDNLSTGKRERLNPDAEFVEIDLTDTEKIKPYFQGIDGVFHVAALPRIPFSIEHPIESAQANIFATLSVLVAARDAGVKRVVYSASSSAYGQQPVLPLVPSMPPNPLNPYALQKYVGEKFMEQFARFYQLETVSLRYFNVYGPRMADEGAYVTVIAILKRQRKANEKLTVQGDGNQTRDFSHVSDVIDANMKAMQSSKVGKGEVVNVGAGERHSVNEIARMIGGEVVYTEGRQGEARDTLADISLTTELLGWQPQVKFVDGLSELLRSEGIEPQGLS